MEDEADTTNSETTEAAAVTEAVAAQPSNADPLASETILGGAGVDGGTEASAADGGADEGEGGGSDPKDGSDGDEAKPAGAPEAYELKAPEGQTFDEASFKEAEPVFRDLNLSNEQAQKLVDVYAAKIMPAAQQAANQRVISEVIAQRKQWADAFAADPEIGGAKAEQTTALAAKGLDTLGFPKGSAFRSLLDDSGLGNHPDMIRAWARVGKAVSEDGFDRGGTDVQHKKTDAELFYPEMK